MINTKQVILIGGGLPYHDEASFREYLEQREVSIERMRPRRDWKRELQANLGDQYEILNVSMPCHDNAHYDLWRLWFEKVLPVLNDTLVIVGHSLGALFLAKYLSEEKVSKDIRGLFLIAAPYNIDSEGSLQELWSLSSSLEAIQEATKSLYLYHSKDDSVVPYTELQKYAEQLPQATTRTFEDMGHFNVERLPQIEDDIKSIQY